MDPSSAPPERPARPRHGVLLQQRERGLGAGAARRTGFGTVGSGRGAWGPGKKPAGGGEPGCRLPGTEAWRGQITERTASPAPTLVKLLVFLLPRVTLAAACLGPSPSSFRPPRTLHRLNPQLGAWEAFAFPDSCAFTAACGSELCVPILEIGNLRLSLPR